jgi:acetylglutamate kinase
VKDQLHLRETFLEPGQATCPPQAAELGHPVAQAWLGWAGRLEEVDSQALSARLRSAVVAVVAAPAVAEQMQSTRLN